MKIKPENISRELGDLRQRFANQEAELELTVRDPAVGLVGHVVVWNSAPGANGPLGPCGKGGTRITPRTDIEEVRMLAKRMALKNAAADLHMGGAKSGIAADPDVPEFEKCYRRFARLVQPNLVENGGIFGGFGFDIGARPEHPGWICDELQSTRSCTGKPVELGGTDYDKEGLAGLGVVVSAKTLYEQQGSSLAGKRFAVQGLGAMGAAVIRYCCEAGAQPYCIADPRLNGCFLLERPPEPELVSALSTSDFETAIRLLAERGDTRLPLKEVLFQEVDILFPCAVQDVLHRNNAPSVKARCVVEAANKPCTTRAHEILHEAGVTVIPDIVANPGGIIAAYVELTSKATIEENIASRAKINEARILVEQKIADNTRLILSLAEQSALSPVMTGEYIALKRVLDPPVG